MVKAISGGLENHLDQEVTSIARCWKIVRTDGTVFKFTAHDADLVIPETATAVAYGLGCPSTGTFTTLNFYQEMNGTGLGPTDILQTLIKAYAPTDFDSTWTTFAAVSTFMYDPHDGNCIFWVSSADSGLDHLQYVVKVNASTGAIVWQQPYEISSGSSEVLPGNPDYGASTNDLSGGYLLFADAHHNLCTLDTSAGTITRRFIDSSFGVSYQTFNSKTGYMIMFGSLTPVVSNGWFIYNAVTKKFYKCQLDTSVLTGTIQADGAAIDNVNMRVFFTTDWGPTDTHSGLFVIDILTGASLGYATGVEISNGSGDSGWSTGMHIAADGYLWVWAFEGNYSPWIQIDPNTLTQINKIGTANPFNPIDGSTPLPNSVFHFGFYEQSGLLTQGIFSTINLLDETGILNIEAAATPDQVVRLCGWTFVTTDTYLSSAGFTNSAIENKSDLSVDNLDIQGVFDDDSITLQDLRAGAFDYADVYVFFVNWQNLGQGILKMRRGKLGEVTSSPQGWFTVELRGMTQLLQQQIVELYGAECRADLFDSRCALVAADYQCTGHVVAVTTPTTITISIDTTPAHFVASDQWFQYGQINFTSGNNNLKTLEIKQWNHTLNLITLYVPAGYPVQIGDTFNLLPGCDKTQPTCKTVFANLVNFRGEPFIPGNDAAFIYPDLGSG